MKLWIFTCIALMAEPLAAARLLASSQHHQPIYAAAPGDTIDVVDVPDSVLIADFDAWEVQQSVGIAAALTHSEDGSLFGLMCGAGCAYYVGAGIECASGHIYTGMLTLSSGALPLTLRCAHIREGGEVYPVMLIDEDLSEPLGAATGDFSLTLALANHDFATSRFSTAGAHDAIEQMLDVVDDESEDWGATLSHASMPQKGSQLPFSRNRM